MNPSKTLSVEHARFIGINKVISTTREDGSTHHNKITEEAESSIQMLTEMWGDARNSQTILAITARKALGYLRQGRFEYEKMIYRGENMANRLQASRFMQMEALPLVRTST